MKKVLISLIVLIISQNTFCQEKEKAGEYYKGIVQDLTKKHLPDIYLDIVTNYYCGPDTYRRYVNGKYIKWNMDTSDDMVYKDLTTVIHESVHGYNKGPTLYKRNDELIKIEGRLLVSTNSSIEYVGKNVVKGNFIVDHMRKTDARVDDLMRFDVYIDNGMNSNSSCNIGGIFGLMDEFSAYYHGSNVGFILYHDLKKNNIMNIYDWDKNDGSYKDTMIMENVNLTNNIVSKSMSSYSAYYEFNVYIGAYLKYVKENNEELYDELMSNINFRQAYTEIDNNFRELASKMEDEFGMGYKAHKDSFFTTTTGVKNLKLAKELLNYYTDILDDFRIKDQITKK